MSDPRSLDGYQDDAVRTTNPSLDDERRLLDAACGMAEESGEVLAHVRKHVMQGRPLDRDAVREELGDVLWCVAMLARTLGIPLADVASANLEKLRRRHPDGFTVVPPPRP